MNLYSLSLHTRILLVSLIIVSPAYANEEQSKNNFLSDWELSGNVALTTDYVFRGITQNNEKITPQGGLTVSHDSGLYADLWSSAVDFNDSHEANVEVDLSLGYGFEKDNWNGDIKYVRYFYPGANSDLNYDYGELIAEAGYTFELFTLGALYAYSPEFFGETGDAHYVQAKFDTDFPYELTGHAYIGKQFVENNASLGLPDTVDWNIGVGRSFDSLDFDVSYTDTNLTRNECDDGCDGRVIATATFNF